MLFTVIHNSWQTSKICYYFQCGIKVKMLSPAMEPVHIAKHLYVVIVVGIKL